MIWTKWAFQFFASSIRDKTNVTVITENEPQKPGKYDKHPCYKFLGVVPTPQQLIMEPNVAVKRGLIEKDCESEPAEKVTILETPKC